MLYDVDKILDSILLKSISSGIKSLERDSYEMHIVFNDGSRATMWDTSTISAWLSSGYIEFSDDKKYNWTASRPSRYIMSMLSNNIDDFNKEKYKVKTKNINRFKKIFNKFTFTSMLYPVSNSLDEILLRNISSGIKKVEKGSYSIKILFMNESKADMCDFGNKCSYLSSGDITFLDGRKFHWKIDRPRRYTMVLLDEAIDEYYDIYINHDGNFEAYRRNKKLDTLLK